MPRPSEIQAEETATPRSPLRRSCRIVAVSSPAPSEVKPVRGRRLSAVSNDDNDEVTVEVKAAIRATRASSVTKENGPSVEPAKTRSRRNSATTESSTAAITEEKKPAARGRRSSVTTEETEIETAKPTRGRRPSVTKEETEIETTKPVRGRRPSITKEEAEEKKPVKGRSSIQEDNDKEAALKPEEPPLRSTRSRRSMSRDLFDDTEETKDVETTEKRNTRSRRASVEAAEEKEDKKSAPRTPSKLKRRLSVTENAVVLDPIDEKEQEHESPTKPELSAVLTKRKPDQAQVKVNLDLSVISESEESEDTRAKSRLSKERESINTNDKKDNENSEDNDKSKEAPKKVTPLSNPELNVVLNKPLEGGRKTPDPIKAELSIILKKSLEGGKKTPDPIKSELSVLLNKSLEDGRTTPDSPARRSPRLIEKCKSGEKHVHMKCDCGEPPLKTKKIDFDENKESSTKSPNKENVEANKKQEHSLTVETTKETAADDPVFLPGTITEKQITVTNTHISEGSDGSFQLNLSKSKFQSTEDEIDLNDSKTSESSDKENLAQNIDVNGKEINTKTIQLSDKKVLEDLTDLGNKEMHSQNVTVGRVSNVFRPKDIDYSYMEPMDVDMTLDTTNCEKSHLDSTKLQIDVVNESVDETFCLNLDVTCVDTPTEKDAPAKNVKSDETVKKVVDLQPEENETSKISWEEKKETINEQEVISTLHEKISSKSQDLLEKTFNQKNLNNKSPKKQTVVVQAIVTEEKSLAKDEASSTKEDINPAEVEKRPTKEDKDPAKLEENKILAEVEKYPTKEDKSPAKLEKSPTEVEKIPTKEIESHAELEKSPKKEDTSYTKEDKDPAKLEENKSLAEVEKNPTKEDKSPAKLEKSPTEVEKIETKEIESHAKLEKSPKKEDTSYTKEDKDPAKLEKSSTKENKSLAKLEKIPTKENKSPAKLEKSPAKVEKSPTKEVDSTVELEKSSTKEDKSPVELEKSYSNEDKSPSEVEKSPAKLEKSLTKEETATKDTSLQKYNPEDKKSDAEDEDDVFEEKSMSDDYEFEVPSEEEAENFDKNKSVVKSKKSTTEENPTTDIQKENEHEKPEEIVAEEKIQKEEITIEKIIKSMEEKLIRRPIDEQTEEIDDKVCQEVSKDAKEDRTNEEVEKPNKQNEEYDINEMAISFKDVVNEDEAIDAEPLENDTVKEDGQLKENTTEQAVEDTLDAAKEKQDKQIKRLSTVKISEELPSSPIIKKTKRKSKGSVVASKDEEDVISPKMAAKESQEIKEIIDSFTSRLSNDKSKTEKRFSLTEWFEEDIAKETDNAEPNPKSKKKKKKRKTIELNDSQFASDDAEEKRKSNISVEIIEDTADLNVPLIQSVEENKKNKNNLDMSVEIVENDADLNVSQNQREKNVHSASVEIIEDDKIKRLSLEEFANAKLDEYIAKKMDDFEVEDENSSSCSYEDSESGNSFIDDMAEEGEEDTPSEDSNAIIDEGEAINSDSERSEDHDDDDDDSFICDEEKIELLSGEEYDLDDKKKKRKSRIINVENRNEDVIKFERKPTPKPRKSRIIKVDDSSSDEDALSSQKGKRNRRSSINIIENIDVKEIRDAALSSRINQLVDTFCTTIPDKGGVSMNLSLEFAAKEDSATTKRRSKENRKSLPSTEPSTSKRKSIESLTRNSTSIEDVPRKQPRLSSSLIEDSNTKKSKQKRRLSKSMDGDEGESKKLKKRKMNKKSNQEDNNLQLNTSISSEDLRKHTFGLMSQLLNDVKNRPRRVIKPSTTKLEDLNSTWLVENDVQVKPSTTIVSEKEMEDFKKKKYHPKDFRQQMLHDSSRVKRIETKQLLKKKGAYY